MSHPRPPTPQPSPVDARHAVRDAAWLVLWAVAWVITVDLAVGGSWNGEYHRTQPFDGFSPPHVFVYSLAAAAMTLVAVLDLRPELRDCFETDLAPTWPIPLLGHRHPGVLLLLTGGMPGIALAGPADRRGTPRSASTRPTGRSRTPCRGAHWP